MGDEHHQDERIRGLRLPHMPINGDGRPPSIRILVAADIDLPSASALAEYTLHQQDRLFDTGTLDLCLVCGPFCREGDLHPYTQKRKPSTKKESLKESLTRSREETAGLEGLFTASLSQLESIVCRVLYVPGVTDPLTTLIVDKNKPKSPHKRLTPNSRNIHQQWLPIVSGLGCAGLTYLELEDDQGASVVTALGESSDEEDGPRRAGHSNTAEKFLRQQRESSKGDYSKTLQRLQELPNQRCKPPEFMGAFQSLFVTHCVLGSSTRESAVAQHREYLRSKTAREQVVVEIDSTTQSGNALFDTSSDSVPVLYPGSLRDHGDFCILECATTFRKTTRLHHWKVHRVDFFNIHRTP